MESDSILLSYRVACAFSTLIPVGLLVFRGQVALLIWSQVNVDSAKPVHSRAREILGCVLEYPLDLYPKWLARMCNWKMKNVVFVRMALNALCWELLCACILNCRIANTISTLEALSQAFWRDHGLLEFLIIGN